MPTSRFGCAALERRAAEELAAAEEAAGAPLRWGPGWISWRLDGVEYHHATPADVAPNRWVFDHPFYLVLNVAVGGNLGGLIAPDTTFPQTMLVDYVRIYEGAE